MIPSLLRPILFGCLAQTCASTLRAQTPAPTAAQLQSYVAIRQRRVDLLRTEIQQIDERLESRLDVLIDTLKTVTDSKDSRTKVARMKEDTGKRLLETIKYYDQKRAVISEELRNPRLNLTVAEKQKIIAVFDAHIEKRVQQILALHKSMPAHEDHERYKTSGGGWYGTTSERNKEYDQNRRMTTHSNSQRDAMVKELDASIERLDRQGLTLKTQIAAATDSLQRQTFTAELAKTDALIEERRRQKLETLKPADFAMHTVALKESMDMDKALQSAIKDLGKEFATLFERYARFLNELSALHATEAALAAAQGRS